MNTISATRSALVVGSLCAAWLMTAAAAPPVARPPAAPVVPASTPSKDAGTATPPATVRMKALQVTAFGGPEVVAIVDVARPVAGPGEVLVRTRAAGVNPVDWKIRKGLLKGAAPTPPFTLGCDVAGEVVAVGDGVGDAPGGLAVGDSVFAFVPLQRLGAFAEFVAVPAAAAARAPTTIDSVHAAAVPVAALTAWQALFDTAGLEKGQSVLIHGAAGGVGHVAVQLAKWKGAKVIATASKENTEFVKSLGADEVIDYQGQRFEDVVAGVDVVFDAIGGETQSRSIGVLKPGGFLVSIVQQPDPAALKARGVRGSAMMVKPSAVQLAEIARLIDAGTLKVTVSETFPLSEAAKALERSEAGHVRGKLVLKVG